MVFIAATRSSTATASRAVIHRLISTSTIGARPVTSESRKIIFVGSALVAAYVMKPSTSSASCDASRIPLAPAQTAQTVAPLTTQFFGPDQRISSFQRRDNVGVPLRLTFVDSLAVTKTKGIHHVGSF
eukprot:CAMPEP_0170782184 /NCGR_PEP_ID=MMETSP0733-20121128/14706_1 /TAXON_ID=186038 /ORGANISM="Fragilariopsis kerguelensis, Strain L26-C5" /LENGTH=127 /DNA_ID=CAMNT_0011126491 /DNA_START=95 /DNA_END=478 /DNA_ORIENTATION=+